MRLRTRSGALGRLRQHPGGPLVEVVDAPNGPVHRRTHPTVPLIVLTESGREHYARHLDQYREHYPELDIPTTASRELRTPPPEQQAAAQSP
ncbi:MAG: hypothetical protein ACRDRW_01250 [Pseudonocardiaceae bacterium]